MKYKNEPFQYKGIEIMTKWNQDGHHLPVKKIVNFLGQDYGEFEYWLKTHSFIDAIESIVIIDKEPHARILNLSMFLTGFFQYLNLKMDEDFLYWLIQKNEETHILRKPKGPPPPKPPKRLS